MPNHVIERDVAGAASVLRGASQRSRGIVYEVGPTAESEQRLAVGDRIYRVRISHVRTIDPTIDDD
jgi:hypothetical protein